MAVGLAWVRRDPWHNRNSGMRNVWALMVFGLLLAGCAHKKHVRGIPPPPPPTPAAVPLGYTETGLASWYGHPYHGRAAADGEIYDMEQMTAAHRTLPFNTWVRVFDLDTNKMVDLRIIDRGPFIDGRIIDISHAAARAIDMIGPGVARVRMEVIRLPEVAEAALFAVQVGAFRDRRNAERVRSEMESRYGTARLVMRSGNPSMWRVLVGSEGTVSQAETLAGRIRQESGEKSNAFVVRVDSEQFSTT
jgi:rare lipoprotein A